MVARLYKSTESGAPQLGTTVDGSLITILRACLVDGFGGRTPAGWTMPFSDLPNNKAVFRAGNSGDYIRVNDNLDYRYAACKGFATMSDVDTGTEEYPSDSVLVSPASSSYRQWKRASSAVDYEKWFVVADQDWFFFVNIHNSATPSTPAGFFFGKYDCANVAFPSPWIITGYDSTSTVATNSYRSLYDATGSWYSRRNYQDASTDIELSPTWSSTSVAQPNPFTGTLDFEDPLLYDDNSSYKIHYGKLPNMFRLKGSSNAGYRGGEVFTIGTGVDEKKYIFLAQSANAYVLEFENDDS